MMQSLYSGVSGLSAFSTQMDVISNNIANINTVGYKDSRVNFRDIYDQTYRAASSGSNGTGGVNPQQVGMGVAIGSIETNNTQGSLQSTGKSTDCAIEGEGFFMLSDGQGKYFSRDGSLDLDTNGNLVSASTGLNVLGWNANSAGTVDSTGSITASSKIQVPIGKLTIAQATSSVSLAGNLDSNTAVGETTTVGSQVYDSLGKSHPISVTFTRSTATDWTWSASSTDGATGSTVGSGTITFDTSGKCTSGPLAMSLTLATPNGAAPTVALQFPMTGISMASGTTSVATTAQDGYPSGTLNGFTIGKDGTIAGTFSNGMTRALGRIALASFANPSGLSKSGSNMLAETMNSGVAQVGQPNSAGMGKLTSSYLEASNVDLSTEFSTMILAQRAFQANSKIITTTDQLLQEMIQMKQ